jgi:hypothetical protein
MNALDCPRHFRRVLDTESVQVLGIRRNKAKVMINISNGQASEFGRIRVASYDTQSRFFVRPAAAAVTEWSRNNRVRGTVG